MTLSEQIKKLISQAIKDKFKKDIPIETIYLDKPEEKFGDYASNIALALSKELKRSPKEIAEILEEELLKNDLFDSVEIAGPGFINLKLNKEIYKKTIVEIIEKKEDFGKSEKKNWRINFEYGDPNTHKFPHIGHLYSYIFGESSVRLLEYAGNTLYRTSYQGDVGLQVAKPLYIYLKEKPETPNTTKEKVLLLQSLYQKGSKLYDESEEAKKEIQQINKKVYEKSDDILNVWKETRQWSLDYYKELEKRLKIEYDKHYFESEVYEEGIKIVKENIGKVFEESEGAIIFDGEKYGLHKRVFITKFGTPTYEAKDVALEPIKFKDWKFDELVITTASEQNGYFKVIYKALEKINPVFDGKLKHIGFGMINLSTGKMSSRTGKIITAEDLLDLAVDAVSKLIKNDSDLSSEEMKEIAESVGVGAVKYAFLKSTPVKDISFDLEKSISFEGDSGPYIQYTYARAKSILRESKTELSRYMPSPSTLNSEEELSLLRALSTFPEEVEIAAKEYSPHIIAGYLFELAQKFNSFYKHHQVLKADSSHREARLALVAGTAQVIKNGLYLLGIDAPEKM